MLAISLGTVYAFYPSIAPYSIIDYQYASVIELWILIISSIPPLLFAILDSQGFGPSGKYDSPSSAQNVNAPSNQTISGTNIEVKHDRANSSNSTNIHGQCKGKDPNTSTTFHDYDVNYSIQANDKYWNPYKSGTNKDEEIPRSGANGKSLKFKVYQTWFYNREVSTSGSINQSTGDVTITQNDWDLYWYLVWICVIFYILCIQIFMSMLHYPHSFLSQFFNNNNNAIGFISVLFNTVRETMQACGFAGAGKQISSATDSVFEYYTITSISTTAPSQKGHVQLTLPPETSVPKDGGGTVSFTGIQLKPGTSPTIQVWKKISSNEVEEKSFNSTIASTNKLITLFVMMFCVSIVVVNAVRKDLEPPLKPQRNQ